MPIRTKTLEYFLGQENNLIPSSSLYTYPTSQMLYIAETGSRIFRSCFAEIFWRDSNATPTSNRGTVTTQSFYFKFGNSNAYFTSSIITSLTDSGENLSYVGGIDLTNYFSASFGNNISQSANWAFSYNIQNPISQSYDITGLAASLYITYTYNDNNTPIRSKTAVIPLGFTGSLAVASYRVMDNIPVLDTYCTESNKTFDSIWVEFEGANGNGSTTSNSCSFFIDFEPRTSSFVTINTQNTNTWNKNYISLNHINTAETHSLKGGVNVNSPTFSSNALTLKATYRYNHDNSNYILNTPSYALDGNTTIPTFTSDATGPIYNYIDVNIQDPLPIVQRNCAVRVYTSLNATINLVVVNKNGGQFTWALPFGVVDSCGSLAQWHIDESLRPFSSSNLQRGNNRFEFGHYTIDAQRVGSIKNGIILNYVSGKDPRGDGVHTHTITELAISHSLTQAYLTPYDGTNNQYAKEKIDDVAIYDPDYYISNYFIDSYGWFSVPTTGTRYYIALDNIGTDNIFASGSIQTELQIPYGDNEVGVYRSIFSFPDYFTKYPRSVCRKNALQSNEARYLRGSAPRLHLRHVVTYHGLSYTVTGSISGYTGDGSGIYVDCIESGSNGDNSGKIFQTITNVGGQFSGSVYDNTKKYYVTARQSATLTSRSDDATGSVIIL